MEVNLLYKPKHAGEFSYGYCNNRQEKERCHEEMHHQGKLHKSFQQQDLIKDLKMELLFDCMSDQDEYLYNVCEEVLTTPLIRREDIIWREEAAKDAIRYPHLFKLVYELAADTLRQIEEYREFTAPKYYQIVTSSKKILIEVQMLEIFVTQLEALKSLLGKEEIKLKSSSLLFFKEQLEKEYDQSFFKLVRSAIENLKTIKEQYQMTVTGHLFLGFKRADYILNSLEESKAKEDASGGIKFLTKLLKTKGSHDKCILLTDTATENNAKELAEANLEGVFRVLSQFNKGLIQFFQKIRYQFGFYYGGAHLYKTLMAIGISCCFPEFVESKNTFEVRDLVDVGLVIKTKEKAVGNNLSVENAKLWLITGANQGGKTTFLRSMGLAVLMAQCGLFVTAKSYKASIFTGIFTHFPNDEDENVAKGLLEVELEKLEKIIECIKYGGLILMNESFATTTEKEGSHIAEEVTRAFRESNIMTVFVTHLFEYASALYNQQPQGVCFYRASRKTDGTRTYEIREGQPLESSHGMDLYPIKKQA